MLSTPDGIKAEFTSKLFLQIFNFFITLKLSYTHQGFPNRRGQGYRAPVVKHGYRAVTVKNRAKFIKNSNYFLIFFEFKDVTAIFILPYPHGKPGNRAVTGGKRNPAHINFQFSRHIVPISIKLLTLAWTRHTVIQGGGGWMTWHVDDRAGKEGSGTRFA